MHSEVKSLCMFRLEYRDVIFDSRVLREAKALTNAYEKVTVIDVLGDKSFEEQEIEGIQR